VLRKITEIAYQLQFYTSDEVGREQARLLASDTFRVLIEAAITSGISASIPTFILLNNDRERIQALDDETRLALINSTLDKVMAGRIQDSEKDTIAGFLMKLLREADSTDEQRNGITQFILDLVSGSVSGKTSSTITSINDLPS